MKLEFRGLDLLAKNPGSMHGQTKGGILGFKE